MSAPGAPPEEQEGAPHEGAPLEGAQLEGAQRRALLEAAYLAWVAAAEEEALPAEMLVLVRRCLACGRAFCRGLRFARATLSMPAEERPYRDLAELRAFLEGALRARPRMVGAEAWEASRRCDCQAPTHLSRSLSAALFRAMPGSGAALVAAASVAAGGPGSPREAAFFEMSRGPHGGPLLLLEASGGPPGASSGAPSSATPHAATRAAATEAFHRPLSLFDEVGDEGHEGDLEGVEERALEGGVRLLLGASLAELGPVIEASAFPVIVVAIEAKTALSAEWPARLSPLAEAIAEGRRAAALVVSRARLLRQLRALGASLRLPLGEDEGDAIALRREPLGWGLTLSAIVREMANSGASLGDACALALDEGRRSLDRVQAFLGAAAAARPGLRFEAEGERAWPVLPDGQRGREIPLRRLPFELPLEGPLFERELSFVCDRLPEWADPSRLCPCGAPASVQRRLLPWATVEAFGPPGSEEGMWILSHLEREGEVRAAEVVLVFCDRHARLISRRALMSRGMTEALLEERLEAELIEAVHRVETELAADEEGRVAILVRGHLAASVLLADRWLAELHRWVGAPIVSPKAEAWAFAPDALCLLDPAFAERERPRLASLAARAGGAASLATAPFALRREVDLEVRPAGTFVRLGG